MNTFSKKHEGFTIIELLIVLVLCAIILMAAFGLYLASDKIFSKTRPISDVLEEARGAIVTLDFIFSRWGTGVPCTNNDCNIGNSLTPCINYPPSDPLCMKCNNGDFNSGCSDVEFYASLHGLGFVVSVNGTQANLISCRLSTDTNDNYYYIWQGEKVANYNGSGLPPVYRLSQLNPNNQDCIKNFSGGFNAQSSALANGTLTSYTLQPGDIIIRVPHKIRLYVKSTSDGYWLYLNKTDMATGESEENAITKLKDSGSFKVYAQGHALKIKLEFQSQSTPEKVLKIERYFTK